MLWNVVACRGMIHQVRTRYHITPYPRVGRATTPQHALQRHSQADATMCAWNDLTGANVFNPTGRETKALIRGSELGRVHLSLASLAQCTSLHIVWVFTISCSRRCNSSVHSGFPARAWTYLGTPTPFADSTKLGCPTRKPNEPNPILGGTISAPRYPHEWGIYHVPTTRGGEWLGFPLEKGGKQSMTPAVEVPTAGLHKYARSQNLHCSNGNGNGNVHIVELVQLVHGSVERKTNKVSVSMLDLNASPTRVQLLAPKWMWTSLEATVIAVPFYIKQCMSILYKPHPNKTKHNYFRFRIDGKCKSLKCYSNSHHEAHVLGFRPHTERQTLVEP